MGLSGSFSFSCDGAGSPTLGTGATSFGGGDLKDWNSFVNICVSVGGAIFSVALPGVAKDYGVMLASRCV